MRRILSKYNPVNITCTVHHPSVAFILPAAFSIFFSSFGGIFEFGSNLQNVPEKIRSHENVKLQTTTKLLFFSIAYLVCIDTSTACEKLPFVGRFGGSTDVRETNALQNNFILYISLRRTLTPQSRKAIIT